MTEQWQELKETITEMRDNDGTGTQQEVCKFLANYMDNLEKQMQEPCEDCISREAVIEVLEAEWNMYSNADDAMQESIDDIKVLPSVTPQPQTGRWIEKDGFDGDTYYDCSECGESFCLIDGTPADNLYKYCPNCGAKMTYVPDTNDGKMEGRQRLDQGRSKRNR